MKKLNIYCHHCSSWYDGTLLDLYHEYWPIWPLPIQIGSVKIAMLVPRASRLVWPFLRSAQLIYFVHVPKCGGKFIEKVFSPWIQKCPTLAMPWAAGHLTYLEYKERFRKYAHLDFDKGCTFGVVRNPWDWHVSWFHYLKGDPTGAQTGHAIEGALFQDMTFTDYVYWLDVSFQ